MILQGGVSLISTNGMVSPKIDREAVSQNYGCFHISPLEVGYGLTLGNALRRVLLSSLEGAAVTSVRVPDIYHEFTDVPGVREDVTQFILQIKQLRLNLHDIQSSRIHLEVKGNGTVTAADLECPAEVDVVNPDLYLFTVDDKNLRLEMEMAVQRGRGYSPAEERGRLPVGELPVDAVFSPVRRVNWNVERARVGQNTGYDKLVLEIWTDGTISPEDALSSSAAILTYHLRDICGVTEDLFFEREVEVIDAPVASEVQEMPIERLDLSIRVFNSLRRTGISTVGEVLEHMSRGDDAMLAIRNFGDKSLQELRASLSEHGYLDVDEESDVQEPDVDELEIAE